ncbi:MAG: hypothetical protein AAFY22_10755 [Pseudomonadota bacterium]
MSLEPLLSASLVIQFHAFAALGALLLGLVQLIAPKGTLPHKALGAVWLFLMAIITISSIFIIPSVHGYDSPLTQWLSWIHVFTIATTLGIVSGVRHLLHGGPALKRHKWPFISIYVGGLVVAGAFTLLPGRIMNAVLFGG